MLLSLVAAGVLSAVAAPVSAQSFFIGGSATVPTAAYGDVATTGLMRFGGILFPMGDGSWSVGAAGLWGTNDHDIEDEETDVYGALARVELEVAPGAEVSPFVHLGFGWMRRSFDSATLPDTSESGTVLHLGGGLDFPVSRVHAMTGVSYALGFGGVDGTEFLSLSLGARIPVGDP